MYFFMQFLYFMEAKKRENKWGGMFEDGGKPNRVKKINE